MTSHPSPFHRQRQSNKTLDPNSDTARFLYTILDQLELKNINWNKVAHNLNITNGHAARMRWSRFKAQLEGVDNSYARRSNKRSVIPKKRKASKVDRQRSYSQAHIYGDIAGKRVETHRDEDMKMENMMGSDLGYDDGARYNTTDAEATRRMSTINGVNVHHPTVTLINTTTPKPLFFPTRLDATSNISGSSQYQASSHSRHPPNNHTYGTPGSQATYQWQQRFPSPAYTHSAQRPSMAPSPYSATPNLYHNPYGSHYPQMYDYNQQATFNRFYPEQRLTSAPFYRRVDTKSSSVPSMPSAQGHQNLADQSLSLNRSSTTSMKFSSSNQPQVPLQGHDVRFPSTTSGDQTTAQVQALELASQASYPWPHSEASLSQFMQNAIEPAVDTTVSVEPVDMTNSIVNHRHHGGGAVITSSTNASSRQADHIQDENTKTTAGHSTSTRESNNAVNEARSGVEAVANIVVIKNQASDDERAIPHIKIEADADGNENGNGNGS